MEGSAIASFGWRIADVNGLVPDLLKLEADQRFFTRQREYRLWNPPGASLEDATDQSLLQVR